MQKAWNTKLKNDDYNNGKIILTNITDNFKRICYVCRKRGHKRQNCPQKTGRLKKTTQSLRATAMPVVR